MSKTNAALIAELKRAKYPFNPVRASNWFGGILDALGATERKSDRIGLLAERTLKEMDIDTRGQRRVFILRHIEKSIRQLCSRGVLVQYKEGRVRLHSDLAESKLEKYRRLPLPWAEEEARAADEETSLSESEGGTNEELSAAIDAEDGGPELAGDMAAGEEEDLTGQRPLALPPLGPVPATSPAELRQHQKSQPTGLSDWSPEERGALGQLLDPVVVKSGEHAGPARTAATQAPIETFLAEVSAVQPRFQAVALSPRSAVLTTADGLEVQLELRRSGELRAFHRIPDDRLTQVLRYVGTTWCALRVAIDPSGRSGVQRTFAVGASPHHVASELLEDLRLIDDAAGL